MHGPAAAGLRLLGLALAVAFAAAAALAACFEDLDSPSTGDGGEDASAVFDAGDAGDAAPDYASAILADGPLAYWRFDDPVGSPTVSDATDGGHVLTLVGSPPTFRVPGALANDTDTAMSFTTGDPNKVSYADGGSFLLLGGNAPFTFEGWIKPTVLPTTSGPYIEILGDCDRNGPPQFGYNFSIAPEATNGDQCLIFQRIDQNGMGDTLPDCGNFLAPNQWLHFAVTYDGATTLTLYLGDASKPAAVKSSSRAVGTDASVPFTVGGTHGYFSGAVDEFAVYGRALTQPQLAAHYAASL